MRDDHRGVLLARFLLTHYIKIHLETMMLQFVREYDLVKTASTSTTTRTRKKQANAGSRLFTEPQLNFLKSNEAPTKLTFNRLKSMFEDCSYDEDDPAVLLNLIWDTFNGINTQVSKNIYTEPWSLFNGFQKRIQTIMKKLNEQLEIGKKPSELVPNELMKFSKLVAEKLHSLVPNKPKPEDIEANKTYYLKIINNIMEFVLKQRRLLISDGIATEDSKTRTMSYASKFKKSYTDCQDTFSLPFMKGNSLPSEHKINIAFAALYRYAVQMLTRTLRGISEQEKWGRTILNMMITTASFLWNTEHDETPAIDFRIGIVDKETADEKAKQRAAYEMAAIACLNLKDDDKRKKTIDNLENKPGPEPESGDIDWEAKVDAFDGINRQYSELLNAVSLAIICHLYDHVGKKITLFESFRDLFSFIQNTQAYKGNAYPKELDFVLKCLKAVTDVVVDRTDIIEKNSKKKDFKDEERQLDQLRAFGRVLWKLGTAVMKKMNEALLATTPSEENEHKNEAKELMNIMIDTIKGNLRNGPYAHKDRTNRKWLRHIRYPQPPLVNSLAKIFDVYDKKDPKEYDNTEKFIGDFQFQRYQGNSFFAEDEFRQFKDAIDSDQVRRQKTIVVRSNEVDTSRNSEKKQQLKDLLKKIGLESNDVKQTPIDKEIQEAKTQRQLTAIDDKIDAFEEEYKNIIPQSSSSSPQITFGDSGNSQMASDVVAALKDLSEHFNQRYVTIKTVIKDKVVKLATEINSQIKKLEAVADQIHSEDANIEQLSRQLTQASIDKLASNIKQYGVLINELIKIIELKSKRLKVPKEDETPDTETQYYGMTRTEYLQHRDYHNGATQEDRFSFRLTQIQRARDTLNLELDKHPEIEKLSSLIDNLDTSDNDSLTQFNQQYSKVTKLLENNEQLFEKHQQQLTGLQADANKILVQLIEEYVKTMNTEDSSGADPVASSTTSGAQSSFWLYPDSQTKLFKLIRHYERVKVLFDTGWIMGTTLDRSELEDNLIPFKTVQGFNTYLLQSGNNFDTLLSNGITTLQQLLKDVENLIKEYQTLTLSVSDSGTLLRAKDAELKEAQVRSNEVVGRIQPLIQMILDSKHLDNRVVESLRTALDSLEKALKQVKQAEQAAYQAQQTKQEANSQQKIELEGFIQSITEEAQKYTAVNAQNTISKPAAADDNDGDDNNKDESKPAATLKVVQDPTQFSDFEEQYKQAAKVCDENLFFVNMHEPVQKAWQKFLQQYFLYQMRLYDNQAKSIDLSPQKVDSDPKKEKSRRVSTSIHPQAGAMADLAAITDDDSRETELANLFDSIQGLLIIYQQYSELVNKVEDVAAQDADAMSKLNRLLKELNTLGYYLNNHRDALKEALQMVQNDKSSASINAVMKLIPVNEEQSRSNVELPSRAMIDKICAAVKQIQPLQVSLESASKPAAELSSTVSVRYGKEPLYVSMKSTDFRMAGTNAETFQKYVKSLNMIAARYAGATKLPGSDVNQASYGAFMKQVINQLINLHKQLKALDELNQAVKDNPFIKDFQITDEQIGVNPNGSSLANIRETIRAQILQLLSLYDTKVKKEREYSDINDIAEQVWRLLSTNSTKDDKHAEDNKHDDNDSGAGETLKDDKHAEDNKHDDNDSGADETLKFTTDRLKQVLEAADGDISLAKVIYTQDQQETYQKLLAFNVDTNLDDLFNFHIKDETDKELADIKEDIESRDKRVKTLADEIKENIQRCKKAHANMVQVFNRICQQYIKHFNDFNYTEVTADNYQENKLWEGIDGGKVYNNYRQQWDILNPDQSDNNLVKLAGEAHRSQYLNKVFELYENKANELKQSSSVVTKAEYLSFDNIRVWLRINTVQDNDNAEKIQKQEQLVQQSIIKSHEQVVKKDGGIQSLIEKANRILDNFPAPDKDEEFQTPVNQSESEVNQKKGYIAGVLDDLNNAEKMITTFKGTYQTFDTRVEKLRVDPICKAEDDIAALKLKQTRYAQYWGQVKLASATPSHQQPTISSTLKVKPQDKGKNDSTSADLLKSLTDKPLTDEPKVDGAGRQPDPLLTSKKDSATSQTPSRPSTVSSVSTPVAATDSPLYGGDSRGSDDETSPGLRTTTNDDGDGGEHRSDSECS